MKIVYCLTDASQSGGMERAVSLKANYLADVMRFDVTVITTDKQFDSLFFNFSPNIKFVYLGIDYFDLDALSPLKRVVIQLKKMKEHKRKLKKMLVDLNVDICISTYTHELSLLSQIDISCKKIAEIHFCKQNKWIENKNNNKSILSKLFSIATDWRKQFYLKRYDAFVVLTVEDKKNWRISYPINVIPNPLSISSDQSSSNTAKEVISVGRLTTQKGYPYLLQAWSIVVKKHNDWMLSIYGRGEYLDKLEKQIETLNIESSVKICSPVKNIEEKYLESSIYVMSSLYEGFGLVLAEAMSCGLPCVSFDCPCGPSEIISDGIDGFLIETKDVEKLADKIIYLIENEEVRMMMGANAKVNSQRFSINNIMPQWVKLFEDVLQQNRYS